MTERVLASTTETSYSYVYDGGQLRQMTVTITEYSNSGITTRSATLEFTYDASGAPQTVTCDNTTYLYVTNLQGDVLAILDSTGNTVVQYFYDAWGNLLNTRGSMANTLGAHNPLRYRGYVYDTETGLYYLQSRYYDPELGRFLNADALVSTGQGLLGNNMFAYCNNNPVNRKDTLGTYSVSNMDNEENGNPFDDYGSPKSNGGGANGNSSNIVGNGGGGQNNGGKSTGKPSPEFSPDQQAVIQLAKDSKNTGLTMEEANILVDFAKEYGISCHGPMVHPGGNGLWSYTMHINIMKMHIAIK